MIEKGITIVIVTYNSTKHIYDCLESIFKFNDIDDKLEVIVVDNHSSEQEDMFSDIRKLYGDRVGVFDSGCNGGYGYGNNIGVAHSKYDTIIVMNPDVRLVKPIFRGLLKVFFENNQMGMAGVSFVDGSNPYYFKRGAGTWLKSLIFKYYIWKRKYNPKTMYMSGSFLAFRREAFIRAGLFDEKIFMYSEEADITNRILEKGYNVVWLSQFQVLHLAHNRAFNPYLNRIRMESGLYYEKKYNIDSEKVYKNELISLKLKHFISALTVRRKRTSLYKDMIMALKEFHKNHT